MRKKLILVIVVLVIILGALGYLLYHKKQPNINTNPLNISGKPSTPINNYVAVQKNSKYGPYLAEPNGQALYTYQLDSFDQSNCTGECLKLWPPYLESPNAPKSLPINFGVIKSSSGLQYTYKGRPLYTYIDDKVDQTNGQNVTGFILAKP